MNINITGRNLKVDSDLSELIKTKLLNLKKYDSDITRIDVVLLKESRAEKIEVKIISNKNIYFVNCYTSVFEKTLAKAYSNLLAQIKKKKK